MGHAKCAKPFATRGEATRALDQYIAKNFHGVRVYRDRCVDRSSKKPSRLSTEFLRVRCETTPHKGEKYVDGKFIEVTVNHIEYSITRVHNGGPCQYPASHNIMVVVNGNSIGVVTPEQLEVLGREPQMPRDVETSDIETDGLDHPSGT